MRLQTSFDVIVLLLLTCTGAWSFVPPAGGGAAAGTHQYRPSNSYLCIEPLAKEGEWSAYLDADNTGLVYYFNGKTGESRWEPPTATFPKVEETKKEEKTGGFLSAIFASKEEGRQKTANKAVATKTDAAVAVKEDDGDDKPRRGLPFSGLISRIRRRGGGGDSQAAVAVDLEIASHVMPHPEKKKWGGEDYVFTKGRSFGVFDGVSGAEKISGIPLYSLTLAEQMTNFVVDPKRALTPKQLLEGLNKATEFANFGATGASTAIVASVENDGTMHVLNVGDSVAAVIRSGELVARSRDISYFFECPYQLSEEGNRPRDGTKMKTQLAPGDFVVMGSDVSGYHSTLKVSL